MIYIVPKSKMQQYLNLEIDDNELFPNDAPIGTTFYDLEPENGERYIVTIEHIINLLDSFIKGKINDNKVKAYVETLIALDLFIFDESSDYVHDLIASTVFTLDELKDVNGVITKEDAYQLMKNILV